MTITKAAQTPPWTPREADKTEARCHTSRTKRSAAHHHQRRHPFFVSTTTSYLMFSPSLFHAPAEYFAVLTTVQQLQSKKLPVHLLQCFWTLLPLPLFAYRRIELHVHLWVLSCGAKQQALLHPYLQILDCSILDIQGGAAHTIKLLVFHWEISRLT